MSVGQRLLHLVYDGVVGVIWGILLPGFLVAGIFRRHHAAKALSVSTVGLPELPAPDPARPRVLVHGVSVGEIKASQSLVAALRDDYDIVVSALSDTGLEVARQLYPETRIVRYPFDFRPLVSRFWRRVQPDYVLLMELEAWPCFLRVANRQGAPIAVVSGRITERSFGRYRMFGTLPEFGRVSLFAAQDPAYAERFAVLARSWDRVLVTGNVKIDGLRGAHFDPEDAAVAELREVSGLTGEAPPFVVVAGSTHDDEEVQFVRTLREHLPEARLIVVPRHPPRSSTVAQELGRVLPAGGSPERLSELRAAGRSADPRRPLLVDTIGELERLYGLADTVFIGGSLVPHGGQNMMEPAAQGIPVVYGPHVGNFRRETEMLERVGAARRVTDADALGRVFAELHADPELRRAMGRSGREAIAAQQGATQATLEALRERCGLG